MTTCKRLSCLALAALALLLAACGGGEDASSLSSSATSAAASATASSASGASAAASSASAPSVSGVADVSASAASPAAALPSLSPGRFNHFEERRFTDERAPYLVLEENGRAVFRLNTGMELAEAQGTYTASGGTLVFTITSLQTQEGFAGEATTQLTFTILSEDHLRYSGDSFGLTLDGNLFTREGAAPYTPPASQPASSPAGPASSVSPAAVSAPSSSPLPAASSAAASQSLSAESASAPPPEEDSNIPVIEPGKDPPAEMKVNDSFRLAGLYSLDSVEYDAAYFSLAAGADGHSAVLTAVQEGETAIAYRLDETTRLSYTILIEEKGFGLWMLLLVAGASLVLGGGGALAALVLLRRRRKKIREAEAEAGLPENAGKAQRKALKKAQAAEKKAEKAAKRTQKKADAAEKKARQAAEKAQQAGSAAQQAGAAAEEAGAHVRKTAGAEEGASSAPAEEAGREDSPAAESRFGEARTQDGKPPPPPGSQVVLE